VVTGLPGGANFNNLLGARGALIKIRDFKKPRNGSKKGLLSQETNATCIGKR